MIPEENVDTLYEKAREGSRDLGGLKPQQPGRVLCPPDSGSGFRYWRRRFTVMFPGSSTRRISTFPFPPSRVNRSRSPGEAIIS